MSLKLIRNYANASVNKWFVVRGYWLCKVEPVIGVICANGKEPPEAVF